MHFGDGQLRFDRIASPPSTGRRDHSSGRRRTSDEEELRARSGRNRRLAGPLSVAWRGATAECCRASTCLGPATSRSVFGDADHGGSCRAVVRPAIRNAACQSDHRHAWRSHRRRRTGYTDSHRRAHHRFEPRNRASGSHRHPPAYDDGQSVDGARWSGDRTAGAWTDRVCAADSTSHPCGTGECAARPGRRLYDCRRSDVARRLVRHGRLEERDQERPCARTANAGGRSRDDQCVADAVAKDPPARSRADLGSWSTPAAA